jgi:catechol 2,3-dioxygenase-like lactoylglutathione lyase family enzyme
MLSHSPVTAIIPTTDLARSRRFYEQQLGLLPEGAHPDGSFVLRTAAGGALALSPRPDAQPSPHTRLSFEVPDLAAEIRDLEGKGVAFDDYDLPDFKTVGHVCQMDDEACAWFRDPDGNILCLHQVGQSH